jgi:predicted glycosyltransferase
MMDKNRNRILYYCQSLVGIGHLTASLQVIRELLQHADVDLIYGGHDIDINIEHPGFRDLRLPTILIDEQTGQLYDPSHQYSIEALWTIRAQNIDAFLSSSYDASIVEFFPFGRRRFKTEIHALFHQLRIQNSHIPIFSFVREVLVPEPLEAEQRMVQSINDYIHTIFIRGDPNVIRFDETFSLTPQIADKICYLGYLGTELPENKPSRVAQILVSQGGGSIGKNLLEAAIRTAPLLPNYTFLIATGSLTTASDFAHLGGLISSDNVKIVPFLQNFKQCLMESALSISLGGDNTLIDVISTQTPGLAFPYPGNSEQDVRIQKLAAHGFVYAITVEDLNPERLSAKIQATLVRPYPNVEIALNGAINMSERIKAILADPPKSFY